METRTIHETDERGEQVTRREVLHQGETYEFEVDLSAGEEEGRDGHIYDGDRSEVPAEVEQALGEFGAGATTDTSGSNGGEGGE